MENQPGNNESRWHHFFCTPHGSPIAIGAGVGVVLGLAMNNIALGIAIGIAIFSGEEFAGRHRD